MGVADRAGYMLGVDCDGDAVVIHPDIDSVHNCCISMLPVSN